MRFWLSGEVDADIGDAFRRALNDVEHALNDNLELMPRCPAVEKWAVIAMISAGNVLNYPEVRKYTKKKKVCEFRLRVDHRHFTVADDRQRRGLLIRMILLSIKDADSIIASGCDLKALSDYVLNVARGHNWFTAAD